MSSKAISMMDRLPQLPAIYIIICRMTLKTSAICRIKHILPQQDFLHLCGRIKHKIIHTTQRLPTTKVHFRFAVTFWYSSCVHCASSCHAFLKPDGVRTGLDTEDESHQHPWRLPSTYWQRMPYRHFKQNKTKNVTRVSQQMLRYKLREL